MPKGRTSNEVNWEERLQLISYYASWCFDSNSFKILAGIPSLSKPKSRSSEHNSVGKKTLILSLIKEGIGSNPPTLQLN